MIAQFRSFCTVTLHCILWSILGEHLDAAWKLRFCPWVDGYPVDWAVFVQRTLSLLCLFSSVGSRLPSMHEGLSLWSLLLCLDISTTCVGPWGELRRAVRQRGEHAMSERHGIPPFIQAFLSHEAVGFQGAGLLHFLLNWFLSTLWFLCYCKWYLNIF